MSRRSNHNEIIDANANGHALISRHYRNSFYAPPAQVEWEKEHGHSSIKAIIIEKLNLIFGENWAIDNDLIIVPRNQVFQAIGAIMRVSKVFLTDLGEEVAELRLVA